jgi:hypothetical protein
MIAIEDCPADLFRLLGFRATIKGQVPTELRVVFGDTVSETDDGYIVVAALDEPTDYLFADAEVLNASAQAKPVLDPSKLGGVSFKVVSQLNETDTFSFCIEDLELIVAEDGADNGDDPDAGGTGGNPDCSSDSLQIVTDEGYWIDGCTNLLGLQGTWYTSTPRGDAFP